MDIDAGTVIDERRGEIFPERDRISSVPPGLPRVVTPMSGRVAVAVMGAMLLCAAYFGLRWLLGA